jgi:hypothetical protein
LDANIAFDYSDNFYGQRGRVMKLDFPYMFGNYQGQQHIDRNLMEKLIRPEVLSGTARIIAARAGIWQHLGEYSGRKNPEEMDEEYSR